MTSKIILCLPVCSLLIAIALAACPIPKTIYPTSNLESFSGKWHSQGMFDMLHNPGTNPACAFRDYHTETVDGKVELEGHAGLHRPSGDKVTDYHERVFLDENGAFQMELQDLEGKTYADPDCYIVAADPTEFYVGYCCKDVGSKSIEAMYYFTRTPKPSADLTVAMHNLAVDAGLEDTASKMLLLYPGTCPPPPKDHDHPHGDEKKNDHPGS